MSQRHSGYERKAHDFYATPAWCTELLCEKLKTLGIKPKRVLEPACGDWAIANVIIEQYPDVEILGTDIRDCGGCVDFLDDTKYTDNKHWDAIITNPPYDKKLIRAFIDKSLWLTEGRMGVVAMLLRVDFDSAKTRTDIFGDHPAWAAKIVMNKRVVWFEKEGGASPSYNHAWFIWSWRQISPKPIILYGPH